MHPKLLELSTKEKSLNTTLDGSPTTFFLNGFESKRPSCLARV